MGRISTFPFMASNLAIDRPIDTKLSPHSQLLGMAGQKGDPGSFEFDGYS